MKFYSMPFFKITVKLRQSKIITGIRQLETYDVDKAWRFFQYQAQKNISECELMEFDCVMLSKLSKEVMNHQTALAKKNKGHSLT